MIHIKSIYLCTYIYNIGANKQHFFLLLQNQYNTDYKRKQAFLYMKLSNIEKRLKYFKAVKEIVPAV